MNVKDSTGWKGVFTAKIFRDGELIDTQVSSNLITTEGKNYIANLAYNNSDTQEALWYLGLFGNNLAPASNDTAAGVAARLGELDAEYSETTRPQWTPNAANTGLLSKNSDAPANFTMASADAIYGAFMISDSAKVGVAGVLLAASNFAVRNVEISDIIQLTYQIELT